MTQKVAPVLSFSTAARFLPDGRYVPTWLYDRAVQAVEIEERAQNPVEEAKADQVFHFPSLQIDIIQATQKARDNLRGASARSSRPPTTPSHRDTRYQATEQLNSDLGPGIYSLAATFTTDDKESSPFSAKKRQALFGDRETVPFGAATHLLSYVEPIDIAKHLDKTGPNIRLDNKLPQRASVQDYAYSTLFSQSRKDLPPEPMSGAVKTDACGRLLTLKDKALSHRLGAIPFESKSKKIDCYPVSSSSQGPGSYTPYTSIGGNGRRKSYRMNANPQIQSNVNTGPSSPSFISISRSQMNGPVSITSDSTMRKTF